MNEARKIDNDRIWLKYLICFAVCAVVSFGVSALMGLFSSWESVKDITNWNIKDNETKVYFVLTNGAFITGILTACFGGLVALANGGAFTMLVYGIRRFISLFQKDVNKIKFKTYYDYYVYHHEKPKKPFLFLVLTGLLYVGISMIFLIIYMNKMY